MAIKMRKQIDPITIRGVTYPDAAAAAEALGVGRKTILRAANLGRLDYVGIPAHKTRTRTGPVPYSVRIRGVTYPSAVEAANALKVSVITVRAAIALGREDFIGLGQGRRHTAPRSGFVPHNSREVVIGPYRWTSIRQAAAALKVHYETLRLHLDAGDTTWLLAKGMQYEARLIRARMKEAA